MTNADLPPVAVIADAHFHDIESDYGGSGLSMEGRQLTLRSWVDTRRSSRVFNESKAALTLALQDIHNRGIKHVVLLGDYTDDGQIEASARLVDLLRQHRDQYGTHFFAITGNHDAFGPLGKHQSTRFARGAGETVLVSSDPKVAATEPDSAILTQGMYCEGVPAGVSRMSEFGLFRQSEYRHWETPFGLSDSLNTRCYDAHSANGLSTCELVDASYLVEPVEGLWLLMIDANVFEPRDGQWAPSQKKAFLDSSDAGWNSLLKNKPHLLDWISEVCTRADQTGKTLIAFSHYPIIDPFADADNSALRLFGNNEMIRRKPEKAVCEKLLHSGLRLHFSGHLHVSALSQHASASQLLEDCAVPSLVAFPACYKVIHTATDKPGIDTIQLSSMSLDETLMDFYRNENTLRDDSESAVLSATNYGDFLYQRMHTRVIEHYLAKEWPKEIAHAVRQSNAADLAFFMTSRSRREENASLVHLSEARYSELAATIESALSTHALSVKMLAECSMTQLVSDWYCLRHAGYLARPYTGSERLRIYQFLADSFGDLSPPRKNSTDAFFTRFLGMLKTALERSEPSDTRERALQVLNYEYSDC